MHYHRIQCIVGGMLGHLAYLRTTLQKKAEFSFVPWDKKFHTLTTFNTGVNCLRELAMYIGIHHPGSTFLMSSKVQPPLLHLRREI